MAQNLEPVKAIINTYDYEKCQVFYKQCTSSVHGQTNDDTGLCVFPVDPVRKATVLQIDAQAHIPLRALWSLKSFVKNYPAAVLPTHQMNIVQEANLLSDKLSTPRPASTVQITQLESRPSALPRLNRLTLLLPRPFSFALPEDVRLSSIQLPLPEP